MVLGMHRSGTSVLTRALSLSGYALPATLMAAGADNLEGYWESRPIADFNDRVLSELGSAWDDPFAFDPNRGRSPLFSRFIPEAIRLIEAEFPRNRSIVLKDPRITVLGELWTAAIEANGLIPKPIICVRHPLDIAASLARRNQLPANRSFLIWLSYQLAAERSTRSTARAFVLMDDLMSDWRMSLSLIEASLGVVLERRDPEAELLIERSLKPELVHHRVSQLGARASRMLPDWAAGAYSWFESQARGEPADALLIERAAAEYSSQRKWFGPILADMNLRLSGAKATQETESAALTERLLQTVEAYEEQVDASKEQILKLENMRARAVEEVSQLQSRVMQLESDCALQSEQSRRDLERLAGERDILHTALENERQSHAADLERLAGERNVLEANLEAQKRDHDLFAAMLYAEAAAQIEVLQVELQTRHVKATEDAGKAQVEIERLEVAGKSLQAQLDELLRETDDLKHTQKQVMESSLAAAANLQSITVAGYESAITAREAEIAQQLSHAQSVINDLETELLLHQNIVRQRTVSLDAISSQHHEVLSSTTWRATRPIRSLGARMHGVSRLFRNTLLAVAGRQSIADPVVAVRALQSHPVHPARYQAVVQPEKPARETARKAATFDAAPVADFILAETGDSILADEWRDLCRTFPMPYDADSGEKPERLLDDEEAASWIASCGALGLRLRPFTGQPDATIIVPVFNKLAFTLSAIASVYVQKTQYTYEILLADDGSSDQTRTLNDGDLPRVRVVRHNRNLGFLRNCNEAARLAKGRIIVLLNNDTVVMPGWLDGLVKSIDSDPGIGLVGSRLLFPDGKLQEAGGLVWQDGSAWNFGRGQDARHPRFSYAREVDYVSGASIAVPAQLWNDLGGFDADHYDTAYYEDADLAFRIREAGRKVLYQPRSTLVHFEGVSSGTDLSKGIKRFQAINGERFFERWRPTLETHQPNGVRPDLECERKIRRRMLVIDSVTPTPDKDGGSLVMLEMLRAFQKDGWRISFIPEDNFAFLPDVTPRMQREGIEAIYWPHYKSVSEFLTERGSEFDMVLISRVTVAARHMKTVRSLAPRAKVIFNTVDLHFLREAREAALSGDAEGMRQSERTKAVELSMAAESEVVIVHSTAERDILQNEAPLAKVYVFPWVAQARQRPQDLAGRESVLFIGGFRHPPNVDAVNWLASDIWPRVRAAVPDAKLRIIGPDAPGSFSQFDGRDGVHLVGWVPELEPELERARLTVAPLRFGAGIKGKVISSISNGVPVVCTPIAAEGMGVRNGREVVVAGEAAELADAIIHLLSDDRRWKELSGSGLAFVRTHYSPEAALRRVREMAAIAGV